MAESQVAPVAQDEPQAPPEPVIIEVGRRSKKQISKLRQGRGPIMRDIDDVLNRLREAGDVDKNAQVVVVVVQSQRVDSIASWCR